MFRDGQTLLASVLASTRVLGSATSHPTRSRPSGRSVDVAAEHVVDFELTPWVFIDVECLDPVRFQNGERCRASNLFFIRRRCSRQNYAITEMHDNGRRLHILVNRI